jgi:hypothetical protein
MSKSDNPYAPSLIVRDRTVTRDYARGVTIGAFVLTFFGAFWASEALTNWPQTPPWAYGVLGVPAVALTLFAILRFINVAKLPEAVDGDQAARGGKRTGIAFGVVVAAEFILIAAASVIFGKLGWPLLIPVAIALIVGLHFFPLARLFHVPVYSVTGLLCVVSSLASLLVADEAVRLLLLGLAIAIILWGSAGVALFRYTGFRGPVSEARR